VPLTGYVQRKREAWNVSSEGNFESFGREERLEDVSHNVDLVFLISLKLLPDYGIVKHVELVSTKLTMHLQRLTMVDYEHLTARRHRYSITCSAII